MATKIDSNQRICLIGYFSKTKNPAWLFDVFTYFLELAKQVDNPVNEFSYYKDGKQKQERVILANNWNKNVDQRSIN